MRLLLFAYEFPPVPAAQSLRWYFLANELARLGVEVDVLTPSFSDLWGFRPIFAEGVRVHRCFPGPFVGISAWIASRSHAASGQDAVLAGASPDREPMTIRAYRLARRLLDQLLIPDVRTEWWPFAWQAARRLHAARRYDLVISSHLPGVDLLLGLRARRRWGVPWIADLGDPVVGLYTPRWRRRLDAALEGLVCRRADALLVTAEGAGAPLLERHPFVREKLALIRQGFDHRAESEPLRPDVPASPDRFTLVFTGTFYAGFRDPTPLIEALASLDFAHTIFAGDMGPFQGDLQRLGDRVTLLGRLPHDACLAWQRTATVLLNLGNRQEDQLPGKIYEYLGTGRPILHMAGGPCDPIPAFLEGLRRGRGVAATGDEIAASIRDLYRLWCDGTLDQSFDLTRDSVIDYSWAAGAGRIHAIMTDLLRESVPETVRV